MKTPIIWLIGPIGLDMILQVEEYPKENTGGFCQEIRIGIGWDAAIIAQSLDIQHKVLFGNHIGFSEDAQKARSKLKNLCDQFIEVGDEPSSPMLNIIISSKMGTRTWFSNVQPPASNDLIPVMKTILPTAAPGIIYSDHWETAENVNDLWHFLGETQAALVFYNWGDYGCFSEIKSLLDVFKFIVVQISLKNIDDLQQLKEIPLLSTQFLLITRDQNSVLLLGSNIIEEFPVMPIHRIDTTGAGGIFSGSVISNLLPYFGDWSLHISQILPLAISNTHKILEEGHSRLYPPYIN